jgi:hypothetical protein
MFEPKIWNHHAILEDGSAVVFHLVLGQDGLPCVQASFASIAFKVFNPITRIQIGASGTVTIASCVFDTPKDHADDPRWPEFGPGAADGYNFAHTIEAAYFPDGGMIYRVEYYAISSIALGSRPMAWAENIPTLDLIGS